MREILFRGKRIDIGEWVEGYLLSYEDGRARICERGTDIFCYEKDDSIIQTVAHEVIPETVGQYIGLTDKNGVKIFEGDIVHCVARLDEANCVVIYEEGEFRLISERNYKTYTTGMGYHAIRCFEKEVIGNIHDNPKLLEVGE